MDDDIKSKKINMCFYGRVSTEQESQISALENQMQWYDDQLKQHNEWMLVEKYIDKGITGTQAKKRPAFLKMIEDAKKGKFDLVVTREVSRFARNTVDTLSYTRELKQYGVEVYFISDNIRTMDNDGELRLTIMATLAQEESRKTSERVKAGLKISREKGTIFTNGKILGYDYDKNEKKLIINEEQAETVRMIYDWYLEGLGCERIKNELYKNNRKNASGIVSWNSCKVARVLRQSLYIGICCYNQYYVNNFLEHKLKHNTNKETYIYTKNDNIPKIIDEDIWDKVQKILDARVKTTDRMRNGIKPTRNLWKKKLICNCGSRFMLKSKEVNKKNDVYYKFQCLNRKFYNTKTLESVQTDKPKCDVKIVSDWKLYYISKYILEDIWTNKKESIKKALFMIKDCYAINDITEYENSEKLIKEKIENEQKKLNNLIEMRMEGELTKEEFIDLRKKIDKYIEKLKTDLKALQENNKNKENTIENYNKIEEILNNEIDFKNNISDELIDKFIQRVEVIQNNHFKWYINFLGNQDELDLYKQKPDILYCIEVITIGNKHKHSLEIVKSDFVYN